MTFLEKDLEDYICEHPEVWQMIFTCPVEIIGRQVHLDHGIADLLGWREWTHNGQGSCRLLLIELKRRKIKEAHIGQLLRYMNDVYECLYRINDLLPEDSYQFESFELEPILIGQSITEKAAIACEGFDPLIISYERMKDGKIVFENSSYPGASLRFEEQQTQGRQIPYWLYYIAYRAKKD